MVVWQGITEGGTAVPIQVTEEGRVVAEGQEGPAGPPGPEGPQGPPGQYGPGDDVVFGDGSFAGSIQQADDPTEGKNQGFKVINGKIITTRDASDDVFLSYTQGNPQATVSIKGNGNITGAGSASFADNALEITSSGDSFGRSFTANVTNVSSFTAYADDANPDSKVFNVNHVGGKRDPIALLADGSVEAAGNKCGFTSAGELYFTSRNARYKLVVSDQLVLAEPYTRQMELREKAEAARAPRPADNVEND